MAVEFPPVITATFPSSLFMTLSACAELSDWNLRRNHCVHVPTQPELET